MRQYTKSTVKCSDRPRVHVALSACQPNPNPTLTLTLNQPCKPCPYAILTLTLTLQLCPYAILTLTLTLQLCPYATSLSRDGNACPLLVASSSQLTSSKVTPRCFASACSSPSFVAFAAHAPHLVCVVLCCVSACLSLCLSLCVRLRAGLYFHKATPVPTRTPDKSLLGPPILSR